MKEEQGDVKEAIRVQLSKALQVLLEVLPVYGYTQETTEKMKILRYAEVIQPNKE